MPFERIRASRRQGARLTRCLGAAARADPVMGRAVARRSDARETESAQHGRYVLVLAGSLLAPAAFACMIVWCARARQLDAGGLVSAIVLDAALWGVSAVAITEVYRDARYRARRQRHLSALATQFAEWVDAQRANWSSRP